MPAACRRAERVPGAEIPDDIAAADLDQEVRAELISLARETADTVARHLVAAGQIIDEDSELALKHAIAARRLASRIAVVREAVGLAAYAAGDWTTAIAELRTYHRMTGRQTHLAELADCERALGRPERAIDLYRGADMETLDKAGAIELLIVAAGARGDLGQHDAAVAMLQVRELTSDDDAEWAARLRYAYADALLAAGRRDEAREWFARAAAVDDDQLTDAAERLLELDGVTIEGDEDDEDDGRGRRPKIGRTRRPQRPTTLDKRATGRRAGRRRVRGRRGRRPGWPSDAQPTPSRTTSSATTTTRTRPRPSRDELEPTTTGGPTATSRTTPPTGERRPTDGRAGQLDGRRGTDDDATHRRRPRSTTVARTPEAASSTDRKAEVDDETSWARRGR